MQDFILGKELIVKHIATQGYVYISLGSLKSWTL